MFMNMVRRCSFVLLFFALGMTFTAATAGLDGDGPVKTLPNISVKALGGETIDIVEHYGENEKITVFCFWATWCLPCLQELNNISDIYEEWTDLYDVEVVAVSVDDARTVNSVQRVVDSKSYPFDILLDTDNNFMQAFGIRNPPHTVLVDQSGAIVYEHTGYLQGDEYELEEKISDLQAAADE